MRKLNNELDFLTIERGRLSFNKTEPVEGKLFESTIYGRETEKQVLISKLLITSNRSKNGIGLNIIPIVGMGGIGKTTLAQLAYNDDVVKSHFHQRIWVHVGDPFNWIDIAKAIIDAIKGYAPNLFEWESLLRCIEESIEGKKFLLVLDDVWTEDELKWLQLKGSLRHGDVGSKILVTMRNKQVAIMMGTTNVIYLGLLSEENCWSLFTEIAFAGRNQEERIELDELARRLVRRCKGLPLFAKTLGTLMRDKRGKEQWEDVLNHQLWELPDVQSNVFAPFLLSYYDLSTLEKRCLSYCSIFPLDHEIDKDDLIELWMSQGYLIGNNYLEIGENCFKSLVMRSFLLVSGKDFHGNSTKLKIHDVIQGFLQFLVRKECFIMEVFASDEEILKGSENTRHYTLSLGPEAQIPLSVIPFKEKLIRTAFIICSERSTLLGLESLSELASLRTLCLRGCGIEKLPASIDKLKHLRYLNLSDNSNLKQLPKDLCNCFKLQTLRLNGCIKLQRLPEGMGELVNLRHLYIDGCYQLDELPKGVGRLTSLRILDMFVVPSFKNDKAMKLGDLNKLKHVKGCLLIHGIGKVEDKGDAERAQLRNKQHLVDLNLNFSTGTGPQRTEDESVSLLEGLQPHLNLKSLEIREYNGAIFSSWIVLLVNLRRLVLSGCPKCKFLPPLGKLPSLESLHIEDMNKVEKLGFEFLGLDADNDTSVLISFPRLKQLCFASLHGWKDWSQGISSNLREEESRFIIMPRLVSLTISNCNSLEALPDFMRKIPLQNLTIDSCRILEKRCEREVGEDLLSIRDIPIVQINHRGPRMISIEETEESLTDIGISQADN